MAATFLQILNQRTVILKMKILVIEERETQWVADTTYTSARSSTAWVHTCLTYTPYLFLTTMFEIIKKSRFYL